MSLLTNLKPSGRSESKRPLAGWRKLHSASVWMSDESHLEIALEAAVQNSRRSHAQATGEAGDQRTAAGPYSWKQT